MSLSADLREFIALLNSHSAEYVIVGAHSLAFHGRPRYTGDIDILVRPSPENAAKLSIVMDKFGFTGTGFKESDFVEPDHIIQLGRIPDRIDLLTGFTGVATGEVFETKIATELEGLAVFMLPKALLIQNKRAVARP
jgi:hypothetical protein